MGKHLTRLQQSPIIIRKIKIRHLTSEGACCFLVSIKPKVMEVCVVFFVVSFLLLLAPGRMQSPPEASIQLSFKGYKCCHLLAQIKVYNCQCKVIYPAQDAAFNHRLLMESPLAPKEVGSIVKQHLPFKKFS